MILSEVPRYAGQTWPCYGVHPQSWRTSTRFVPFAHDGRVVHWGPAHEDHGAALEVARRMAEELEPRQ